MSLEFLVNRNVWADRIEMMLVDKSLGKISVGNLVMQTVEPNSLMGEPTVSLKPEAAQSLMDELWRVGLRPSEGSGSAGSLAATERHLADMQRIAIGALKKEGLL